jgi:hypothetical protein
MHRTRHPAGRRTARALIGAAGLVALTACTTGPGDVGEPSAHQLPADSIVLAAGQDAWIERLRVSFLGVGEDSRCPVDVVCIWQGDAEVRLALAIGFGPDHAVALHTAADRPAAELGGYRVVLLGLAPVRHEGTRVPQAAYRATIRVEAVDPAP